MGIFDDKKAKQIEYLEEERKKLWNRITSLEVANKEIQKEIQRKSSDSEKEAAHSSRKAAEFRNKTERRLEEATNFVTAITNQLISAKDILQNIEKYNADSEKSIASVSEITTRLDEAETDYFERLENLDERIRKFDVFFEKYPNLDNQLAEVDDYIAVIGENVEKSGITLNILNKRKKEIDDLHREVFGYTDTDEAGKTTKIEGLKDEIANTYDQLSEDVSEAAANIEKISDNYESKFSEFEKNYKEKYNIIVSEITALLPNALTAGLSAAFSKKKEEEVKSSDKLQRTFSTGIYLLIAVSFIPFIMSAIFLMQGIELNEAIRRLPRLVLAIIPMYIPVLWFTYSANKKLNLSKRLIEEYAHKEVLSKTYEGLSKQIENINDIAHSDELKFRLLSNFLQVSSENPGKLISNYEASDHPIMEALEQSYKFQIAIDRLDGIPGLGKVAAIFDTKAKKKLESKKETIEKALEKEEDEDIS